MHKPRPSLIAWETVSYGTVRRICRCRLGRLFWQRFSQSRFWPIAVAICQSANDRVLGCAID
jgi:hypothetical protein